MMTENGKDTEWRPVPFERYFAYACASMGVWLAWHFVYCVTWAGAWHIVWKSLWCLPHIPLQSFGDFLMILYCLGILALMFLTASVVFALVAKLILSIRRFSLDVRKLLFCVVTSCWMIAYAAILALFGHPFDPVVFQTIISFLPAPLFMLHLLHRYQRKGDVQPR